MPLDVTMDTTCKHEILCVWTLRRCHAQQPCVPNPSVDVSCQRPQWHCMHASVSEAPRPRQKIVGRQHCELALNSRSKHMLCVTVCQTHESYRTQAQGRACALTCMQQAWSWPYKARSDTKCTLFVQGPWQGEAHFAFACSIRRKHDMLLLTCKTTG